MSKVLIFEILLILSLCLVSISAAMPDCEFTLPTVKKDVCQNIIQTCSNCTWVNITSIYYPTSNGTILNLNLPMTKYVNTYNYSFCGNTVIGTYLVSTYGNPDGVLDTGNICYEVTPTGDNLSGVQGALYFIPITIFGILLMFFISKLFISSTPGGKVSYILLAYVFALLPLTFSIYQVTKDYLPLFSFLISVLYYFLFILIILTPLVFLISMGYLIIETVNRLSREKLVKRGYSESEAETKVKRKR